MSEEEFRSFFQSCGDIENVRLIREPKTYLGKGIGYVMFKTTEGMKKAIAEKDGEKFKNRELRVKRAVDPKRREKKQRKKLEAAEERRQKKVLMDEDEDIKKNFEDAYSSDDSDDDTKKVPKHIVDLKETREAKDPQANQELKMENIISFNKRKRQQLLKNMIANQGTLAKNTKQMLKQGGQEDLFKRKVWKNELRSKIEFRRTENLKKINKMKVTFKRI